MSQTRSAGPTSPPVCCSTVAGTMKIPEPMTVPMTMKINSRRPRTRSSVRFMMIVVAVVAAVVVAQVAANLAGIPAVGEPALADFTIPQYNSVRRNTIHFCIQLRYAMRHDLSRLRRPLRVDGAHSRRRPRRTLGSLALAVFSSAVVGVSPAAAQQEVVAGTVVAQASQRPIPGAEVAVTGQ